MRPVNQHRLKFVLEAIGRKRQLRRTFHSEDMIGIKQRQSLDVEHAATAAVNAEYGMERAAAAKQQRARS